MKLFYLQIKRQYSIFHAIIVDMFTIYDLPHILANKFVCGTQLRNNIVLSVACFAHIRRYQFGWENAGTFTNNNKHDKTINASNRFTQNVWRKIALHSKWKWQKKRRKIERDWKMAEAKRTEIGSDNHENCTRYRCHTISISIWEQVHFLVGNI